MYKKALYTISDGDLCAATQDTEGNTRLTVRENGHISLYTLTAGGKSAGARAISYADACFLYPFAKVEIVGEEIVCGKPS